MGVFFCAILAISLEGVCTVGNFSGRAEKAGRIDRAGASVERVRLVGQVRQVRRVGQVGGLGGLRGLGRVRRRLTTKCKKGG